MPFGIIQVSLCVSDIHITYLNGAQSIIWTLNLLPADFTSTRIGIEPLQTVSMRGRIMLDGGTGRGETSTTCPLIPEDRTLNLLAVADLWSIRPWGELGLVISTAYMLVCFLANNLYKLCTTVVKIGDGKQFVLVLWRMSKKFTSFTEIINDTFDCFFYFFLLRGSWKRNTELYESKWINKHLSTCIIKST